MRFYRDICRYRNYSALFRWTNKPNMKMNEFFIQRPCLHVNETLHTHKSFRCILRYGAVSIKIRESSSARRPVCDQATDEAIRFSAICTKALFSGSFYPCTARISVKADCRRPRVMAAPKKAWNAVAAPSIDTDDEEFKRDTEVQVKLVTKPSREYVYELLTKARFPVMSMEAIIERRSSIVDFTCKDRVSAKRLVRSLEKHPNVREARLFESEFIDVKLTGVPHRLPDGRIIALISKRNGDVISIKRSRD